MQMMDRLLNTREGAELVERISWQAKESGLSDMSRSGPERGSVCGGI